MTTGRLAEEKLAPDEAETIERFKAFIETVMDQRAAASGGARRRFNQTRGAGCVDPT